MKKIICIYDQNENYIKKLASYGIKNYGKKYIYLSFTNIDSISEYATHNKVTATVLDNKNANDIERIKSEKYYILVDSKAEVDLSKEYKTIYRFQKAERIFEIINGDIEDKNKIKKNTNTKVISIYSPYQVNDIFDKLKKAIGGLSKTRKILCLDLDEYTNYKKDKGLSNIIYKFKESNLDEKSINNEITKIDNIDIIPSVKFPEDFSVVNNYEISQIVDTIRLTSYDYLFIFCDDNYVKNQYIISSSDCVIVLADEKNDDSKIDIFKKYIEEQNIIDMKKVNIISNEKISMQILLNIIKETLNGEKR